MLHKARGLGLSAVAVEAAADVGGTWFWNRYPGARCDIESLVYSYSFSPELEQEWEWSERYAAQAEILEYARHVADRFDLRPDIQFNTRVERAAWDETHSCWRVSTDKGGEISARFFIAATGCLSVPLEPDLPGKDNFRGDIYYTSRWPHEPVDFTGKRVAVIGTGSSGIQTIPRVAEQAAQLTVFQRTANFTQPVKIESLESSEVAAYKAKYREYRAAAWASKAGAPPIWDTPGGAAIEADPAVREQRYRKGWESGSLFGIKTAFDDLSTNEESNRTAAEFFRARIGEIVKDPQTAELLTPKAYPFGTKRVCMDSGYYATFNRDNVTLVDLRSTPIVEINAGGIATADRDYEIDAIILATGFDAVTGALTAFDVVGCDGLVLRDKWAAGASSYLGLAVAGFPNMFTITGPGSPSVVSNVLPGIEQHVDWIGDCLSYMSENGYSTFEATEDAEGSWDKTVADVAEGTLYPKADSLFLGANVPGKPRVFLAYLGGFDRYIEICDEVALKNYEGFTFQRSADAS